MNILGIIFEDFHTVHPTQTIHTFTDFQCQKSLAELKLLLKSEEDFEGPRLVRMAEDIPVEELHAFLDFVLKSKYLDGDEISEDFVQFLIELVDSRYLTNSNLARCLQRTLLAAYGLHPHHRCLFDKLGLGKTLVKVLKRETSRQDNDMVIDNRRRGNESAMTCHLIASLFPNLEHLPHIDEIESIDIYSILYDCYTIKDFRFFDTTLKTIFSAVFDVCRSRRSCLSYDILLLKLIYWTYMCDVLSPGVTTAELVHHARSLLSSDHRDEVKVGMAVMSVLLGISPGLIESDAIKDRDLAEQFMKEVRRPHVSRDDRSRLIQSMLEFIMFSEHLDIAHLSYDYAYSIHLVDDRWVMGKRQSRLQTFAAAILSMPRDVIKVKGRLILSPEGVRAFEHLVKFVVHAIEDLNFLSDMASNPLLDIPKYPGDVNLGFVRSSAFSKVLGFSHSPKSIMSDPNVQALRLASILHAVNENWGDLFCALTRGRLIDRKCFVSALVDERLCKKFENIGIILIPEVLRCCALEYAFLTSFLTRWKMSNIQLRNYFETQNTPFRDFAYTIDRSNPIDSFIRINETSRFVGPKLKENWNFTFQGESGTGCGSTREFYSEFSHDIQRHDLNLWIVDREEANTTGNQYVRSESGLFLTPFRSAKSENILEAIGKVMAQSLVYGHKLDINFSPTFYKCLFPYYSDRPFLSLADIIVVMPNLSRFVESLVDALRERRAIEEYGDSLTEDERSQALANITCDGCSFHDLMINFTFPGYPDVEMNQGGSEVWLNIDNVEEYLKLLVWWLFYKNTKDSFACIRKGFQKYVEPSVMNVLYLDEMELILCGIRSEQWSVRYLAESCDVEDFPPDSPVPDYLFEVLSSLTVSEQGQFLMFVRSSKKLPIGGLKILLPRLTIKCKNVTGDPDLYLPSSMTCFNLLFLTEYTSKDRLRERLLFAIREGANSFQL